MTTTERAKEQARAQLNSIIKMVERLVHYQECAGEDDCELTDREILEGLDFFYEDGMTASEDDLERYHYEDEARHAIEEDPLEVSVRDDWHTPGSQEKPTEYRILLCTGGPACQITGSLGRYQAPEDAKLQYQDWFTPWVTYPTTSEEGRALLTYAQQFYFGE